MKISLKCLLAGAVFSTTIFSGTLLAQDPLPTIVVVGVRPNSWSCTGQCVDQFFAQYNYNDSNINYDSMTSLGPDEGGETVLEAAQRIPGVLQCAAEEHTRNGEAWAMYKAVSVASKGVLGAIKWDEKQIGGFFSFMFADGTVGIYQRTDSQFAGSDGMVEIKAPCGK